VRPLLYRLIDERYAGGITEKVRMLLEAEEDVSVRVRDREYESVLDREGVSVVQRMRQRVCQYSDIKNWYDGEYRASEYKRVVCEIKKHVRRNSI
jgi:hypothetical protein